MRVTSSTLMSYESIRVSSRLPQITAIVAVFAIDYFFMRMISRPTQDLNSLGLQFAGVVAVNCGLSILFSVNPSFTGPCVVALWVIHQILNERHIEKNLRTEQEMLPIIEDELRVLALRQAITDSEIKKIKIQFFAKKIKLHC